MLKKKHARVPTMNITFNGLPGSGKSTVAQLLAKKLGYQYIYIGDLRRKAAQKKNMTIDEFNQWSKENPKEGDHFFDEYQKELGSTCNNYVFDGWLSYLFVKNAVKLFLDVDPNIAAKRVYEDKKRQSHGEREYESVDDVKQLLAARVESRKQQYLRLYNANPFEQSQFDIIINTNQKTPQQVVDEICQKIEKE